MSQEEAARTRAWICHLLCVAELWSVWVAVTCQADRGNSVSQAEKERVNVF